MKTGSLNGAGLLMLLKPVTVFCRDVLLPLGPTPAPCLMAWLASKAGRIRLASVRMFPLIEQYGATRTRSIGEVLNYL
jgi:hypothetical protein